MSAFDPTAAEILIAEGPNFVASYRNVVVQVRTGAMTVPDLEHMVSIFRLQRAKLRGKEGALVAVLEESAELSTGKVRRRQQELIRELLEHERSWVATIVDRSTAKGALLRTFMRLLVFGHDRAAVFGTPLEAATWLETRVNIPPAELAALVTWGRTTAATKKR